MRNFFMFVVLVLSLNALSTTPLFASSDGQTKKTGSQSTTEPDLAAQIEANSSPVSPLLFDDPPVQFDNNTPTSIPDFGTVNIPFGVSGINGVIAKVTLSIHITHSYAADLDMFLISPLGTAVELSTDNGGSGSNYGAACSPLTARTTFDDEASASIVGQPAPFSGTFRPEGTLSAFVGLSGASANGAWILQITDDEPFDEGTFQCASLLIYDPSGCVLDSIAVVGGNGNNLIDPNECNDLYVTLKNLGGTTLSGIQAVLSTTTPSVSVLRSTSAYPDLEGGARAANLETFGVRTSPDFVCGTPVEFTLAVTYNGGSANHVFTLNSGCETGTTTQFAHGAGYWKNHPSEWPVNSLVLGTSNSYDMSHLMALLNPRPAGPRADASLLLARQLIAAKLNEANCAPLCNTHVADADILIGTRTIPISPLVTPNTPEGQQMIAIAAALEACNSATDKSSDPSLLIPEVFRLEQNYPNPFNPSTVISYSLPYDAEVVLEVCDILGQRVALLVDEQSTPGSYDVVFNADGLASGLYLYRLHATGSNGQVFSQIRKLMLVK